ncbi:MAG: hypothetical protein U0414_30565 [Polyangiaceae bacterium]
MLAHAEGAFGGARKHVLRAVHAVREKNWLRRVYRELEEVDVALRRFREAGAVHRRMIELEPESAWAKGNYALFLLHLGDIEGAITNAEAALETASYGAAHHALALAYAERGARQLWDDGDRAAARRSFETALKHWPGLAPALYGKIACDSVDADERDEPCTSCRQDLQRLVAEDPKFREAKISLDRF